MILASLPPPLTVLAHGTVAAFLPASSMGIITMTVNGQHEPLFWQATGVRSALAGQSVSTKRLAAKGSPIHQLQHSGEYGVDLCVFMRVWMWVCLKTALVWWYVWLFARACMRVSVRERGEKKGNRFCDSPSSHTPGCQDVHGGICLMYSIYSLHTRCCTTASSVALDTPLAGRVAINQPEWRVSRRARKLKLKVKSTSKIVEISPGILTQVRAWCSNSASVLFFFSAVERGLSYAYALVHSCGKQLWFVFSWPCNILALNLVTVLRQMAEHHGAWQIGKWKHACSEMAPCIFSPATWPHKVHSE